MPKETLKYPYVQIKIEIRNRSRTTIPLIKGIHHPDTCTGHIYITMKDLIMKNIIISTVTMAAILYKANIYNI